MRSAEEKGYVAEEIAPLEGHPQGRSRRTRSPTTRNSGRSADRDECNRPSTTLEGLSSSLKPVFKAAEEGGTVTAGNASQLSDGASATLLMSADRAKQLGVSTPLGIYRGTAVAGCQPEEMGIGPVFAVPKLLQAARTHDGRHRHRRAQRGLRFAASLLPAQLGHSRREAEPQRRLDFDRPPVRHDRVAHDRPPASRAQADRASATASSRCASVAVRAWRRSSRLAEGTSKLDVRACDRRSNPASAICTDGTGSPHGAEPPAFARSRVKGHFAPVEARNH